MRKLLVRILNLVYIAAAGVSVYALCKKPILQTSIKINMTGEQVGEKLAPILANTTGESSSGGERAKTRGGDGFDSYINPEKIASAFKDGFSLTIPVEIPASYAFDFKNDKIITTVILDNFDKILTSSLNTLVPPLRNLILSVAEEFAKDALKNAINEQLSQYLGEGSSATIEQVNEIYNNIFDSLTTDGGISVSDLTDVIVNGKTNEDGTVSASALSILNETPRYLSADPQPDSQEALEAGEYFVKDNEGHYVAATTYETDITYYVNKPYTSEDIEQDKIEQAMTSALENVPGLVEKNYVVSPLTGSELEAAVKADLQSDIYFVESEGEYKATTSFSPTENYYKHEYVQCDDSDVPGIMANPEYYCVFDGEKYVSAHDYDPSVTYFKYYPYYQCTPTEQEVLSSIRCSKFFWQQSADQYVYANAWDPSKTYYVFETKINDIDTALTYLITDYYLKSESGDNGSRSAKTRAETVSSEKSEAELRDAIKQFILSKVPIDKVAELDVKFGKYVPYALLALIGVFALPWAWFAFISLIRTLRRRKCWTRPGIVFVWAFPQVFLGLFLTYGTKYALPLIAGKIDKVKEFTDFINFDIKTGCLVPSFIYGGIFVLALVYWIIVRPLKVEWRFNKILDRRERERRWRENRMR